MAQPVDVEGRVRELHDRAVRELVGAHMRRSDHRLVLAVRYMLEDPMNIHLFEVLDGFPGGDDDDLMATEFPASAELLILGKLHLLLGSPAQVNAAIARRAPEIDQVRNGEIQHTDGSGEAQRLKQALGL